MKIQIDWKYALFSMLFAFVGVLVFALSILLFKNGWRIGLWWLGFLIGPIFVLVGIGNLIKAAGKRIEPIHQSLALKEGYKNVEQEPQKNDQRKLP